MGLESIYNARMSGKTDRLKQLGDEHRKAIGTRIEALMAERRMSRAELGRRVGVAGQAVSQWVTGKTTPTDEVLVKVADALGVGLDQLDPKDPAAGDSLEAFITAYQGPLGITNREAWYLRHSSFKSEPWLPMNEAFGGACSRCGAPTSRTPRPSPPSRLTR